MEFQLSMMKSIYLNQAFWNQASRIHHHGVEHHVINMNSGINHPMVKNSDITIMKSSPSGIICPREKASRDRESWNQVLKNLLLRNQLLWNETLQPLILTTIKDDTTKL